MNSFKDYKEYLADNPEGYWFRRKLYGWGWTPARWQGWLTTLLYIAAVAAIAVTATGSEEEMVTSPENFFIPFIGVTFLFLVIAWRKGESPKWQWGKKKEDSE